jgi:hypothetical protein
MAWGGFALAPRRRSDQLQPADHSIPNARTGTPLPYVVEIDLAIRYAVKTSAICPTERDDSTTFVKTDRRIRRESPPPPAIED